jgi:phage/plasmid-associated DNA primase
LLAATGYINFVALQDGIFGVEEDYSLVKYEGDQIDKFYLTKEQELTSEEYVQSFTKLSFDQTYRHIIKNMPETLKFLKDLLDFKEEELTGQFSKIMILAAVLIGLKSQGHLPRIELQKFLGFFGAGGSGKSAAVNWLLSFTNPEKIAYSDLMNLRVNRFETAQLKGKDVIVFNEVVGKSSDALRPNELSTVFQLTGSENIRSEAKFEDVVNFRADSIVILTSNFSVKTKSVENYGALRRRSVNIMCDRFYPTEIRLRAEEIEKKLAPEVDYLLNNLLGFLPHSKEMCEFIENFDSEALIISHKDYTKYERYTDPYFSYLSDMFIHNDKEDTFISFYQI